MNNIEQILSGVSSMGIAGHVRPDGDAVGTCMALYLYVKKYHPEIQVDVYLENPRPVFDFIPCFDEVLQVEEEGGKAYDLFVTCDVSALDRLSAGREGFAKARHTVCIDHHCSNFGFAEVNHVRGSISSCCEVLFHLLDPERIDRDIATALYTGIVHDTGVFEYSSTSPDTLRIAARLMETGLDFGNIIEDSFYRKTYLENQVLGRVLAESILVLNDKVVIGYMKRKDMEFYGVDGQQLSGVVRQLTLTRGIEVAMFLYEHKTQMFKVSLRSTGLVDVAQIASYFGGGGHLRAAGCELSGSMYDVITNVNEQIQRQLQQKGLL